MRIGKKKTGEDSLVGFTFSVLQLVLQQPSLVPLSSAPPFWEQPLSSPVSSWLQPSGFHLQSKNINAVFTGDDNMNT